MNNTSRSTILKRQSSTSTANKPKRKTEDYEINPIEYDVPTTNYASLRTQTSTNKRLKTNQLNTPKKKLSAEDDSLRIVTSTVQGMKHWTNKHLPYPVLFEVFGKLDSQVTYIPSIYSRQFSLLDNKDRIECLFSEIDQTFSNIDRDVQLRIICRMDSSANIAHCLTIRVANKDEWQEKLAIIKQCDIQLNEDDHLTKKSKKRSKK